MVKRTLNYFGLNEFPPRSLSELVGIADLDFESKYYIYAFIVTIINTTIATYIITL